jgi:hypothetical protein
MSQGTTSPLTQDRVTRRGTGRRRGESRRSFTTTATPPLLHQETTTMTRLKRNRLIKTIHLIILVFRSIPMLICFQFLLVNLHTFWSHKMCSHLFSLHPSIWEIVENGMHFDSADNPVFINEQIHKNAQATTVLLASLCRDEYNKVSGLDNAKQIWDTLKISHEGNDATMITKMELVEGELGRFAMIRGEEPTQTYNRLKTLVNNIRSYGSTRWTDHDVVRLMLRSFTVIDPHLVNLIRENPRYTKMTPEEILGKFVSGRMMVKEARYVDDALNGPLPVHEPQTIALKATSNRETLPSKVAQVEAAGLNEDEMALIIKRFKTALKGRKEYPNKNKARGKRSCFKCGKTGHFIAQCPDNDDDQEQEKHGKKEKNKVYKAKGEAHLGKEWDSDCSSSDSDDEGLAASAFNKSSLFPNERHTCLMAKEKKVSVFEIPLSTLLLVMRIPPMMK